MAYKSKHAGAAPPTSAAVALPLAQSIAAEGSLSSYFQGTNNLGAMHATSSFATLHARDAGFGMVAFLDHAPGGGAYITRMSVYPSLSNGARSLLDLVERMVDLGSVQTPTDYATALYLHGYFEGFNAPVTPLAQRAAAAAAGTLTPADQANIAAYANLIASGLPQAQAAVDALPSYTGNPSAVTSGNFAPLADRLTPSSAYAPHTIDHARTLLGAAADTPPAGGISLADALAAPGGDGVWMFGPTSTTAPTAPSSTPATTSADRETVAAAAIATAAVLGAAGAIFAAGFTRRART